MQYFRALATDYDGTIAHDGVVDEATISALERLKQTGRRLVMVTGRELPDLERACPRLDLFDRVVAENGALLYKPATKAQRPLGPPPPEAFVAHLRALGLEPLSVGRVIVATWEPNEAAVLDAIRTLGLDLQIIFNKGAVMVLPNGINKASGLGAALEDLGLSAHNVVATGDAENDLAFMRTCGCAIAVGNALPAVKEAADVVTAASRGQGVVEAIDAWIENEHAFLDAAISRHSVPIGTRLDDKREIMLRPDRGSVLITGTSGRRQVDPRDRSTRALVGRPVPALRLRPRGRLRRLRRCGHVRGCRDGRDAAAGARCGAQARDQRHRQPSRIRASKTGRISWQACSRPCSTFVPNTGGRTGSWSTRRITCCRAGATPAMA